MIDPTFILNAKIYLSIQQTRITAGNRIFGYVKESWIRSYKEYPKLLRIRKDKSADRKKTAAYEKKVLKSALAEHNLTLKDFESDFEAAKASNTNYQMLVKAEKQALKEISKQLKNYDIYENWLTEVKGIGESISIKLLSAIRDIKRFKTPSSLWTYFGLAPGQRKRKGQEANFNPELKALALGVIGKQLLMANSQYRVVYDEAKEYIKKREPEWDNPKKHPGHYHKWANRKMVKRFFSDMWQAWYKSLGMEPPCNPYITNDPRHTLEPMIVEYEDSHGCGESQDHNAIPQEPIEATAN